MNFFNLNRKRNLFKIIKLYRIVDLEQARKVKIHEIINSCTELMDSTLSSYPDNYEVNYGKKQWKSKKGFNLGISKLDKKEIYNVIASFSNSKTYFSISNSVLNISSDFIPNKSMVTIEIAVPKLSIDFNQLISFLSGLYNIFEYDYGYIVELNEDYDFSTEKKIKKKLFGQEISIEEIDKIWRFHSVGINYGFLKNVYPINILNKTQISQPVVNNCLKEKIGKVEQINNSINLWILTNRELSQVQCFFKQSKYLIANKDTSKYFSDSEESKRFYAEMKLGNNSD